MRTTLNIDEDVLRVVRSLAKERRVSLGTMVSDLLRRSLAPAPHQTYRGDLPVFQVNEDAVPITPEMVRRALEPPRSSC